MRHVICADFSLKLLSGADNTLVHEILYCLWIAFMIIEYIVVKMFQHVYGINLITLHEDGYEMGII